MAIAFTINKGSRNELVITVYPETQSLWIKINSPEGDSITYILNSTDISTIVSLAQLALEGEEEKRVDDTWR